MLSQDQKDALIAAMAATGFDVQDPDKAVDEFCDTLRQSDDFKALVAAFRRLEEGMDVVTTPSRE